jgi:hypothetical protein
MSIHARLLRFFPAVGAFENIVIGGDFDSRAHASALRVDSLLSRRFQRRRVGETEERFRRSTA